MAKYSYLARNSIGQIAKGEMDGANETEVKNRLRSNGLQPIELKKYKEPGSGFFTPQVKGKDLQVFSRQFATLINAGIPVVDSLKILEDGMRSPLLKEACNYVRTQIEQGKRLAEAMRNRPQVFDRLFCNMVQAGEESGILDTILQRLAMYIEKSEKLKSQIKGAMVYPAVIIAVAVLVISGILVFVIPKFLEIFKSSGQKPPALTQAVVNISDGMIHHWVIFLGCLIGIPFAFSQWIKTPEGKEAFDQISIKLPVFGDVVQRSAIAKLARTLSTLLSSGVGILDAIEIAARTSGNSVVEKSLVRCKESISEGRPFASPLAKEKIFPEMVVQMIAIGEQSGTLDSMLGKIADFYEDEVESAVKAMTSLIEPLLMVGLGSVIAVLVIAMYLPVFNMGNAVGN